MDNSIWYWDFLSSLYNYKYPRREPLLKEFPINTYHCIIIYDMMSRKQMVEYVN